jgi:2-polyprenyl-6-methoxyphenol hydroxylase-like FAD-dependent oxidoreductase
VEYEHHDFDIIWFVVERPPDWSNTMYVSLGQDVRGLILPKYPQHLQAGIVLPTGGWRHWRDDGVAAVADRVRRFDPSFQAFADSLHDFTPFFPLEGRILLLKDWARDGLVVIGDAAHTMSPAGAIGVNVALASAAVAAQVLYPLLGHGPVAYEDLQTIQQLREGDVRTLHRFQLGAQRVLVGPMGGHSITNWLIPKVLPLMLHSPLLPKIQRRMFFGAPLPPLDPAFRFPDEDAAAVGRT